MSIRMGECYPRVKRIKATESRAARDLFDELPDDLVTCILCRLSSTAASQADFMSVLLTCKRINELGLSSIVLAKSSIKMLSIRPKYWCESAHNFLKRCADSGNAEACYTLGMIRFYCLQNRGGGASLLAKAAINSHAPALYSLAVIQFNGSGGSKTNKDLRTGVALCVRAAFLGHVDALRELGHCFQDGYGVTRNIAEGRRFLVQANARELASARQMATAMCQPCQAHGTGQLVHVDQPCQTHGTGKLVRARQTCQGWHTTGSGQVATCPLLSDFGCDVPAPEAHPASQFLAGWFSGQGRGFGVGSGLRMCSHAGCGRPETRRHEFRRCSVCGAVNYCSRACQALDWKMRHKGDCVPMNENGNVDGEVNGVGNGYGESMVES